jgi:hypothetical protein
VNRETRASSLNARSFFTFHAPDRRRLGLATGTNWMKLIYPLLEPLRAIVGCVFLVWAYTKKPHAPGLKQFGIRIVASADYGNFRGVNDADDIYESLRLLERYDPDTLREITQRIRIVFLCSVGVHAGYFSTGKVCVMNRRRSANAPIDLARIELAGALAYLASLAQFGGKLVTLGGKKRTDIETLCREQQQRVIQKLSDCSKQAS